MGLFKNAAFAIGAVAVIVVSLLFLYPGSTASATTVTLQAGGVTAIDRGTDDDGSTEGDNFFDLSVTVAVGAGEHIPLDYAAVFVAPAGDALDGDGHVTSPFCTATTGGTPSATILSVTGATPTFGSLLGTGYDIVDTGYEFVFDSPYAVDFSTYGGGSGYGYGGATAGEDLLTVHIRVTGCSFTYVASLAETRIQAFVGATSALGFWSTPLDIAFFDPSYVSAVPDATGTIILTGTATDGGGQVGYDFNVGLANVDDSATLVLDLASLNAGNLGGTITLNPQANLPAGTRITLTFFDLLTDPSVDDDTDLLFSPPPPINPTALLAQSGLPPAGFFTLELEVPGDADADENALISSVTITLNVPQSYFTGQGFAPRTGALRLRAVGFDSDTGFLDSINVARTVDCTSVAGFCIITYTISQFSSFALVIGAPRASGGGGTVPAVTPPPTTVTTTGTDGTVVTTTSPPGPGDGSDGPGGSDGGSDGGDDGGSDGGGKKTGIPGPAPLLLLGVLAAAVLLARRRLR